MSNTTTPTVPRSLTEAVNELLQACRLGRVASLDEADITSDASAAKAALDTSCREMLRRGWEFNTERCATYDPDANGVVNLPLNTLKVISSQKSNRQRLTERGGKLYDPEGRTYNVGKGAQVDIVLGLPFEELPETARLYATALAGRMFCPPRLPDAGVERYTKEYLMTALTAMEEEDNEAIGGDLGDTSPHFALHRRR